MRERKKLYHASIEGFKKLDEISLKRNSYPLDILIESVGFEMALKLEEVLQKSNLEKTSKIVIVCGRGNNGADALVLARVLFRRGYEKIKVVFLDEEQKLSAPTQEKLRLLRIIMGEEAKIVFASDFNKVFPIFLEANVIIDGLYGTGYKKGLSLLEKKVIQEAINAFYDEKLIISLDVPTALNDENKKSSVTAHHTLSVAAYKDLFFSSLNQPYCGEIHVVGGDFPRKLLEDELDYVLLPENNEGNKKIWENKYTRGVSLIIGSSSKYDGALTLNVGGALRGGSGYLKVLSPNRQRMENFPQVVLMNNKKTESYVTSKLYEEFENEIASDKVRSLLIGSGMDRNEETKLFFKKLTNLRKKNIIIDGDGLYFMKNLVKEASYEQWREQNSLLFTPHWGEFVSLLDLDEKFVLNNLFSCFEKFVDLYGANFLLKDAGNMFLFSRETKGKHPIFFSNQSLYLSKAGSGDILAGLILGNFSYHENLKEAAEAGVLQFVALGKAIERRWGRNAPITYLYEKI